MRSKRRISPVGDLAAVEAEVVGAGAVGEGVGVEDVWAVAVGVEVGNFEVELAGLGVPVEWEVAVDVLHACGFGGDGFCGECGGEDRGECDESQGRAGGHDFVLHHGGEGDGNVRDNYNRRSPSGMTTRGNATANAKCGGFSTALLTVRL